jgi:hypothetical protein
MYRPSCNGGCPGGGRGNSDGEAPEPAALPSGWVQVETQDGRYVTLPYLRVTHTGIGS